MSSPLVSLGRRGEKLAKEHLIMLGYKIVELNYRYERAEIDLIVKNDRKNLLVFVEVKTRRNKKFGEPEESVTEQKQNQLVKAADGFLMTHPGWEDYDKRFDVIAIMIEGNKETINHIENAF